MSTVLFVRHGQSEANAAKMIATPDSPLSEFGKQQAAQTGGLLKEKHISKIVCSPYLRSRQTAEIIAKEIGYDTDDDIEVIDELRERGFGEKEGGPKDHETPWYYLIDHEYGIESQQELILRLRQCLEKLRQIAKHEQGVVLAVGHATAGFYLRQLAKGHLTVAEFDPPKDQKNAAIIELTL
ncbi:MAG TPA: histidine phosphatase family protein [Candidatus Saccharimonadales bacterium]